MPNRKFTTSIAAGATVNVDIAPLNRAGPRGGRVSLYATQPTAIGDLLVSLLFGTDVPIDAAQPNVRAAGEIRREADLIGGGIAAPFDPITLRVQNTAGVATLGAFLLDIEI